MLKMQTTNKKGQLIRFWNNICRASNFFQDWWAEVAHGAKNGGSFSDMMGPSLKTLKKEDQLSLNAGQKYCRMLPFCNSFDLH